MENELTLRAPQYGVVGQAPRVDDVGKLFDPKDSAFALVPGGAGLWRSKYAYV